MVVPLMHAGQPDSLAIDAVNFAAQDLPASVFSHASSAVSSASFPLARLAWHLSMHAISLPAAFAAPASHFALVHFGGGMSPVSSPPNGVPVDPSRSTVESFPSTKPSVMPPPFSIALPLTPA